MIFSFFPFVSLAKPLSLPLFPPDPDLVSRIQAYAQKMARALKMAAQHADEVETVDVTFDDAPLPTSMGFSDPITTIVGFS